MYHFHPSLLLPLPLLIVLLQLVTLPSIASQQIALSQQSSTEPSRLLSPDVEAYIDELRERWGVKGIAVAVVRAADNLPASSSPSRPNADVNTQPTEHRTGEKIWLEQTVGFGSASSRGDAVTPNVGFSAD